MKLKALICAIFAFLGCALMTSCANDNKVKLMGADDGETDVDFYVYYVNGNQKLVYPNEIHVDDDYVYIDYIMDDLKCIKLDTGDFYYISPNNGAVIYFMYVATIYKTKTIESTEEA